MESKVAKAHLKQLRMTPRKVKVVLDLIRNKNVGSRGHSENDQQNRL